MTRGRKRQMGKREPSGRLSRKAVDVTARLRDALDRDERDTISVGVEARVRVHHVEPELSRDQRAGSFVGRLCMTRVISQHQYEAAMNWLTDSENYSWAVCAPKRPNAIDLNRVHGSPTRLENVALVKRIMARYKGASMAVRDAQLELRNRGNLFGALEALVLRDIELEHMVPDLRCALNSLVRFYGLVSKEPEPA
jgi:hypothetical protein